MSGAEQRCPAQREERWPCPLPDAEAHICTREAGHTVRHLCACGRQWAEPER